MVAELEFDSVIPPPDKIEEGTRTKIPEANNLKEEPSHVKFNSTRELSEAKHSANNGLKKFSPHQTVSHLHNVDSEVSRIKSSS